MTEKPQRTILHADMDAFYASVEQRDDPELRGKPVIVAGLGRRGVVSAASYEARKFGVRSAMPTAQARERCPHGEFVRGRMHVYAEVSGQIRAIFGEFTPLVEPLSLDEAFLDVTGCQALLGDGKSIARRLRARVLEETELTISVGVATSKFVAKVASDCNKPDGLTVVAPGTEVEFLGALPIARLWGVGPRQQHRLKQLGYQNIADLQALDLAAMETLMGENLGEHFYTLCRGIDERTVESEREIKSISHEVTFERDLTSREKCHQVILDLSAQVGRRLRKHELLGQVIRLKVRDPDFTTRSRQKKLTAATCDDGLIYRTAIELFSKVRETMAPVRLLGVAAAELQEEGTQRQGGLFDAVDQESGKSAEIMKAMDRIRDRFGEDSIRHGLS